jgi:hypothetical protein
VSPSGVCDERRVCRWGDVGSRFHSGLTPLPFTPFCRSNALVLPQGVLPLSTSPEMKNTESLEGDADDSLGRSRLGESGTATAPKFPLPSPPWLASVFQGKRILPCITCTIGWGLFLGVRLWAWNGGAVDWSFGGRSCYECIVSRRNLLLLRGRLGLFRCCSLCARAEIAV